MIDTIKGCLYWPVPQTPFLTVIDGRVLVQITKTECFSVRFIALIFEQMSPPKLYHLHEQFVIESFNTTMNSLSNLSCQNIIEVIVT